MSTRRTDGRFGKRGSGEAGKLTCPEPGASEGVGGEYELLGKVVEPVLLTGGIERELKVVRVCANPKLLLCEYMELESRRTCVVNVRNNRKFVKGMKFKMREPVGELEYLQPWIYQGVQPRRRGRW